MSRSAVPVGSGVITAEHQDDRKILAAAIRERLPLDTAELSLLRALGFEGALAQAISGTSSLEVTRPNSDIAVQRSSSALGSALFEVL